MARHCTAWRLHSIDRRSNVNVERNSPGHAWKRTRHRPPTNLASMKRILYGAQRAGPYLLVELLLPGGTLVALLLFVFRNNKLRAKLGARLMRRHPVS